MLQQSWAIYYTCISHYHILFAHHVQKLTVRERERGRERGRERERERERWGGGGRRDRGREKREGRTEEERAGWSELHIGLIGESNDTTTVARSLVSMLPSHGYASDGYAPALPSHGYASDGYAPALSFHGYIPPMDMPLPNLPFRILQYSTSSLFILCNLGICILMSLVKGYISFQCCVHKFLV